MLKDPKINSIPLNDIHDNYLNYTEESVDYKTFWEQQKKMLYAYHSASLSGTGVVQMQAEFMDQLIKKLWKNACEFFIQKYQNTWPESLSLIALGGYGRFELSPHSDIDLLLLYPEKSPTDLLPFFLDTFNEEIIHPLWDLKILVRHTHRTIHHCILDAKNDFKLKNAQLDARLICGSKKLFEIFQEKYEYFFKNESPEDFESEFLEEKNLRHQRADFTVFLQEPNIKTGVGGLLDYQTMLWLARAKLQIAPNIEAIENYDLITATEAIKLKDAYNFLLKVRNELHFQNNSGSNLLNLEKQESIALALGYEEGHKFAELMKDYYEQANNIYEISKHFEERLEQSYQKKQKKFWLNPFIKKDLRKISNSHQKHIDGFIITDSCIFAESKNVFFEDPIRLIRIFRYIQLYHVELDMELKTLIKESVQLIDKEIINDPSANRAFCSIFQFLGEVYPILMMMHELEVLQNFLPEFKNITYLIQRDQSHRYTVDIHTLNTIQILDNIFHFKDKKNQYYDAIKNTTWPWLLYLILLLHELGKATESSDSTEACIAITKPILERFRISAIQQEYILFVIKNNFQMINFWKGFDIDDPLSARAFALFVGDVEILNYFYVQTYCNYTAITTGIWNSHKEMLHTKLFKKTLEFLVQHKNHIQQRIKHKKDLYKEIFYQYYPNITPEKTEKMLMLYPDNYFMLNSPEEFEVHIQLLERAHEHIEKSSCSGSLMPIIHWEHDLDSCLTIVTIVTWDRSGFLASVTGALASCGFNVFEEKGFSRTDQMSITIFYLTESYYNNTSNNQLREEFYEILKKILINDMEPLPAIEYQIKKYHKNMGQTKRGFRSLIKSNSKIDIHHDPASKKTIVEIHCKDHLGLLYQFCNIITRHGFNITFSKVSTEYGSVISTFHIQKINLDENISTRELILFRESINKIFENKKP